MEVKDLKMTDKQLVLTVNLFRDLLDTFTKEQLDKIVCFLVRHWDEDNKTHMEKDHTDKVLYLAQDASKEKVINALADYLHL
jgi:hypothetical protein